MSKFRLVLLLLIPITLLQGCATAVVTGAATGAAVVHDRRSTGAVIDDQGIEFKAAAALFNDKEIYDQSHINVTSYNGVVLITGETLTEELKRKIGTKVNEIAKVRRIHNELMIAAPSALPSRSTDAWITSKVKAKLTTDNRIDPFFVKVVTERGVVYLMGLVSRAESDVIVDIVTKSAGVQRVIKIFEYID